MGTLIVASIVIIILVIAVYSLYRGRKKGKGCDSNCGNCDRNRYFPDK